ncbi:transcriptional regulator, TetR family [Natronincola peptidivorans]|uniref:Transcriptional regulator, TetR family n=1 Tax=Natronincola peptidivorans TaxID=426128 RepID=A0A1I0DC97_9FIRM|nr:TetR/AcrR family transcriptional regulator [Natronincola peptidivorans]SET29935.1 transcriptional regulator, TetR family [Natronincola peptidivorans]
MSATDTKEAILNAASSIIIQRGINHFTLEEVARAAGVSKGGLLYHFPSKNELIKEMLAKLLAEAEGGVAPTEHELNNPYTRERWLLEYIKTSYTATSVDRELTTGLLAAIATNKELIGPIRDYFSKRQQELDQCEDPVLATIIKLASDGMRFAKILDIDVLSDEAKGKVALRLKQLLKESSKNID